MSDPLDAEAERQALAALVASDGWRLLVGYANTTFSARAMLGQIAAWTGRPLLGQETAQKEAASIVLAKFEAIQEFMKLPANRIAAIDAAEARAQKADEAGVPSRGGYR